MYRFLLRPRWIAGHLLLIVAVVAFVNLGFWQLGRLEERRARNALMTTRLAMPTQPLDDVLAEAGGDAESARFRKVELTGTFAQTQLLTAPRSFDGQPGHQVLGVLERAGTPAVLVDRGWIPFDRAARPPPVPPGPVQVTGIVRAAEPGAAREADQVTRIAPASIADRLDRTLAPVYVQAVEQQPSPVAGAPRPTPLPELTEGSHQSYAVQWFSFAVVALIGYPLLIRRTARQPGAVADAGPTAPPSRDVTGTSVGSGR
ncbi:MAG: SURF1 family protein [Actinobacteria bacterium]|nr:SURF1 family protein [Actinomycetota bacterium]